MQRTLTFIKMWMLLCLFTIVSTPSFSNIRFLELRPDQLQEKAYHQNKPYLVHFTASWCMPCQYMETEVFQDQALSDFINKNYLAIQLDIDSPVGNSYSKEINVKSLPSIAVFAADGSLIQMIDGSQKKKELLTELEHLLSKNIPKTQLLVSPKPIFSFSRPALQPSSLTPTLMPVALNTTPNKPQDVFFTPKSGEDHSYWAVCSNQIADYQDAVSLVMEMERVFADHQVVLQKESDQYVIKVGQFDSQTKAKSFFNYYQRNDFRGKLLLFTF